MSSLKDELFNKDTVTLLSDNLKADHPSFDDRAFIDFCVSGFEGKELKERMSHVRVGLQTFLDMQFKDALILFETALSDKPGGHFIYGSVLEYIEVEGCNEEHVDLGLEYLGRLTKIFSSEFAIRPYFNHFPDKTMKRFHLWSLNDNVHIRRFASEGARPKLPWAKNINIDYKIASKPLNNLYFDTERYVTRSVANHLNDISKIDPDYVLDTLKRWINEGKQNKQEMDYIVSHSLRTLIKKGHIPTLSFLGYKHNPKLNISDITLSHQTISVGEILEFSFDIERLEPSKLIIDYIVTYITKNGKETKKVYKLKTVEDITESTIKISAKRSFKPISTRNFYPGKHKLEIQINGTIYKDKTFILK